MLVAWLNNKSVLQVPKSSIQVYDDKELQGASMIRAGRYHDSMSQSSEGGACKAEDGGLGADGTHYGEPANDLDSRAQQNIHAQVAWLFAASNALLPGPLASHVVSCRCEVST